MSDNVNLQFAKDDKFDEFYTLRSDISNELKHYDISNKIVFCPCDNPNASEFWKYLKDNFQRHKLKLLISTYLSDQQSKVTIYDGSDIRTCDISNGDFRKEESLFYLRQSDIIITNPPFSLFKEMFKLLIDNKKDFIVLGNLNAVTYKEIFPYIQENKVRLGVQKGTMSFKVPDIFNRKNAYIRDGVKYAKFGNICWYTTLSHDQSNKVISLTATYKDNEDKYPKYDNYDAINVNKVTDIPKDYYGSMGVPVTYLQVHNPNQFQILGNLGSYGVDGYSKAASIFINGTKIYKRILIRRHNNVETQ